MEDNLTGKIERLLEDKKAKDIQTIEISEVSTLADYFIIATATSTVHAKALSDHIEVELKKEGVYASKVDGRETATWILLDYSSVIVHIFAEEERKKYNLEELIQELKKRGSH